MFVVYCLSCPGASTDEVDVRVFSCFKKVWTQKQGVDYASRWAPNVILDVNRIGDAIELRSPSGWVFLVRPI